MISSEEYNKIKLNRNSKPKNLKEELELITSINRDYGKLKGDSYSNHIIINGEIVRGCSNCYGLFQKCPDAFSEVSHLCNSFDKSPMFGRKE